MGSTKIWVKRLGFLFDAVIIVTDIIHKQGNKNNIQWIDQVFVEMDITMYVSVGLSILTTHSPFTLLGPNLITLFDG